MDRFGDWATDVVETLGYVGVAFLMVVESVFPPIPSEAVLPLAGFVAGRGDANVVGMIVAATFGSLVGAWILYGVAFAVGPARLRLYVIRFGGWFGVREHHLDRAEHWFDQRAVPAVLLGRCVPLVRSIVSFPAGFRRMGLVRFSAYTAIGSAMWNATLIVVGAVLGDRWDEVGAVVGLLQSAVILGIVALAAFAVWRGLVRPRLKAAGDLPPDN